MNATFFFSVRSMYLWPGAQILCNLIVRHFDAILHRASLSAREAMATLASSSADAPSPSSSSSTTTVRVLELGAGVGLCSLGAGACFLQRRQHAANKASSTASPVSNAYIAASSAAPDSVALQVIATDRDSNALELVRTNFDGAFDTKKAADSLLTTACCALDWGADGASEMDALDCRAKPESESSSASSASVSSSLSRCIDLLVGSDLLYAPAAVDPLFWTVDRALARTSFTIIRRVVFRCCHH